MTNNETSTDTTVVAAPKKDRMKKAKAVFTNPYVIAAGTGLIGLTLGVTKTLIEKKIAESTVFQPIEIIETSSTDSE